MPARPGGGHGGGPDRSGHREGLIASGARGHESDACSGEVRHGVEVAACRRGELPSRW